MQCPVSNIEFVTKEEHDSRVTELLTHNNKLEERARGAERANRHLRKVIGRHFDHAALVFPHENNDPSEWNQERRSAPGSRRSVKESMAQTFVSAGLCRSATSRSGSTGTDIRPSPTARS